MSKINGIKDQFGMGNSFTFDYKQKVIIIYKKFPLQQIVGQPNGQSFGSKYQFAFH